MDLHAICRGQGQWYYETSTHVYIVLTDLHWRRLSKSHVFFTALTLLISYIFAYSKRHTQHTICGAVCNSRHTFRPRVLFFLYCLSPYFFAAASFATLSCVLVFTPLSLGSLVSFEGSPCLLDSLIAAWPEPGGLSPSLAPPVKPCAR